MMRSQKRDVPLTRAAIAASGVCALAMLAACAGPSTAYFPAVEYSVPGNVRFALRENAALQKSECERRAEDIVREIRLRCPTCAITPSCSRGLDAEARQVLSKDPLPGPSVRSESGKLTMTISADDPQVALATCRGLQTQTASLAPDAKLRCFAGGVERKP